MSSKVRWTIIVAGGFFLFLDQLLKWLAVNTWAEPRLANKYFGWELYFNSGIAFSLPLSNTLIIAFTMPMIILIAYLLIKNLKNRPTILLAWTAMLAGAVSNLADRLIYKHVIDYFRVLTGVVNFADIMIASGLIIYLLALRSKPKEI
ncbi:MAG: signal peptidase II [Patescibacteria group bacterium]